MKTEPPPSRTGWREMGRALRHPNFRLFATGQIVSLIGTWMQTVAQSWLIYRLTDSAFLLGLVGFMNQVPVFLAAPLGGLTADHANRHRILLITQTSSMTLALVLAGLTLGGAVQVWHILVLAALLGLVNGFDIPARQAFVVQMVERDDLPNAIALNSSIFNGARMVGPAIAGVLVASVGEGWCFLINGISYLAVIGGLLRMRLPTYVAPPRPAAVTRRLLEGFGYASRTRPIRALLVLLAVISFTAMPYSVLMPVFAEGVLHSGARGLGILMASSGLGALAGSVALAAKRGVRGLGLWVALSAGGVGVSLIVFSLSGTLWLSSVLLLPLGFFVMLSMASSNTLIQSMVPDELRGRVMSVYSMMFMGGAPIGSLLAGAMAQRIGAPLTLAAGGLVSLAGGVAFALRLPSLRSEARRLLVTQQMAGGEPPDEVTGTGAPLR